MAFNALSGPSSVAENPGHLALVSFLGARLSFRCPWVG